MKKILLFVVSLWMTVALSAQDYFGRQMYVIQNGCVTFSAPVEKVDTIKFVVEDDMTSYGHEYVDLGLSVMWATCNVGASTPEEYGDYFAWGETKTKTHYDWSTYKWCNGSSTLLTKYCEDSSYGTVDSKIALDKIDDAATVYWGGDWRMPTTEEFEELIMNCTCLWTTQNGVNGCKVTSNINGNSIFLPAAGIYIGSKYNPGETGDYWPSTLHPTISSYIYTLGFTPEKTYVSPGTRCYGRPIRAVYVSKLLPTMTTAIATQITENSAVTGGNVTNDGNATVTERGVVYSTSNNPTTADGVVANGTGMGAYVCNLTGLQENTTYYARAYAINEKGTNYGEEISFTTKLILLPTLTTTAVSQIIENTAVAGGNVTSDGNATVTDRGVVYSTSQNPTVSNYKVSCGSGTGAFTCALTGLQYNTTYYVRAYATNKKGTAYGEEMVFTTDKQILLPTVTTTNAMQITETSAIAGGDVTSDGNADVTERGVVYSISSNPTTSSSKIICGSGTGAYSCTLTGLKKNTTYYVRAYAINSKGTSYGSQVSFATQAYEYVDLGLSVRWATCNVGASTPEEYGDYFAWGETQPKTAYDWTTYIWCNGSYNRLTKYNDNSDFGTVDGKTTLDKEDDAAAVNWGENWRMPTYEELDELKTYCTWTFSTQNGVLGAKVTSNINGNTIFIPLSGWYEGGELINGGSRALLWSNAIDVVTPYGVSALGFGGAEGYGGFLTISVQGRSHGRTVRAVYAGVALPAVNTADVTQITTNSAVVGGEVINDGNATVTERGVVYSTYSNPTTSSNKVPCGSGTGAYSCTLTGLQPNTTYYARAYAINNEGTSYGLQVTFTTDKQISLPTVTTTTATQITESTAVMGGNVTSDGNATVTERGVVYSTYSNPTTSNSKIICGSGTGSFTCTLTGLQSNTTYYARAYAINSKGTSYGSQVTFKTATSSNTCGTQTFTVNGVSFTMVGVEGGIFTMGATSEQGTSDPYDNEYPTHSVILSNFAIGETEVTQELWQAVMGSNPSYFKGSNKPVERVSWNDCQTFITKLNQLTGNNFRLPTEAEWEYAARGGNKSRGYKYAGSNTLSDVAWYADNNSSTTQDVKGKQPNELGLYDMSGNVCEWCRDWYGRYSSGAQTNPNGPSSGSNRVCRGGGWNYHAHLCRVSYRFNRAPAYYDDDLGLRLVIPNTGNHEYVDLGLSVKWATCNVGASTPEEYGDYFAWGALSSTTSSSWANYPHADGSYTSLTKYNTNSDYGIVDSKIVLELSDDVANYEWGGTWRIPTEAEIKELMSNCTFLWTTQNGVNGCKVTSNINGNSIFLPAAGNYTHVESNIGSVGYYWSSLLNIDSPHQAYKLAFTEKTVGFTANARFYAFPVRPVCQ